MNEQPKRRAPAFPLYADDFLAGTSEMSAEEVGAYIRLLCQQWTKGGLPNDPDRLARMAGLMGSPMGSPSSGYVLAKFSLCQDGLLRNARLERIREERDEFVKKQSEAGKIGALRRWGHGDPNGVAITTPMATPMANGWPKDSSPLPSPSPKEEREAPSSPTAPKKERKKAEAFVPPTIEEAVAVCLELGMPQLEARRFINYHEAKGWVVGKHPMKSWRAAMSTWHLNFKEFNGRNSKPITETKPEGVERADWVPSSGRWQDNPDHWKHSAQ